MKIIKVESCWSCPERETKAGYERTSWCPINKRTFDLFDYSTEDIPEWCELDEIQTPNWCPNCGKEFDSCKNCEAIFRTIKSPDTLEE